MNAAGMDKVVLAIGALVGQLENGTMRSRFEAVLRGEEPQQPDAIKQRVVSGDEAARILGMTRRSVTSLAKAGHIKRAVLPGRLRGFGYTRESVEALAVAEGGAQ